MVEEQNIPTKKVRSKQSKHKKQQRPTESMSQKKQLTVLGKQVKMKVVVISSMLFVLLFLSVVYASIYFFRSDHPVVSVLARVFPYPAVALSGKEYLWLKDIEKDMDAVEQFYEEQDFEQIGVRIDWDTPKGKKRSKLQERLLINKQIEDFVIRRYVLENGQRVTDNEVASSISRRLSEYGSVATVSAEVERLYGWTLEDFAQKVIRPELYKAKAQAIYAETAYETHNRQARELIDEAYAELPAREFADVAREYSDGESGYDGGHIGFVALDTINPTLSIAVSGLEDGAMSEVIESDIGYHIVILHKRKKEGKDTYYDVSQIFKRKLTFADYLNALMTEKYFVSLLWEYKWDRKQGVMVFRDKEMQRFELEQAEEVLQNLYSTTDSENRQDSVNQDVPSPGY